MNPEAIFETPWVDDFFLDMALKGIFVFTASAGVSAAVMAIVFRPQKA